MAKNSSALVVVPQDPPVALQVIEGQGATSALTAADTRLVFLMFFLSGFSALIYEVAWLSRIQLVMGHTVYSLATTLAAYLSGLALGSWAVGRLLTSRLNPLSLYVTAEAAIGPTDEAGATGETSVSETPAAEAEQPGATVNSETEPV